MLTYERYLKFVQGRVKSSRYDLRDVVVVVVDSLLVGVGVEDIVKATHGALLV